MSIDLWCFSFPNSIHSRFVQKHRTWWFPRQLSTLNRPEFHHGPLFWPPNRSFRLSWGSFPHQLAPCSTIPGSCLRQHTLGRQCGYILGASEYIYLHIYLQARILTSVASGTCLFCSLIYECAVCGCARYVCGGWGMGCGVGGCVV